ncbi:three-Cys-motif partner protein TcmP [Microtetraspora malaysiensis]|uniref:three-Cys-motif partner protein TcmP n=1 Tax=Microtetraspora malaysiensis TaxID=161358 RepID=UPI003D8C24B5
MASPKTTHWELDPHTKAKHEILRSYLGGWFPVLSTYNGRVVFLDGFAGPGRYENGEPGSPIIALTTLLDHSFFPKMKSEFLFVFCEPKPDRFESLQSEVKALMNERAPWPRHVKVILLDKPFQEAASNIVEDLKRHRKALAPTFAFVDPFGISGLPIELLRDLLASPRCELFVNYMVDSVNRFAGAGNVDHHLTELFGTDRYKEAANPANGQSRQQFLHDLYENQLKSVCGFSFVQSFGMINKTGHIGYYLFYGTRDVKGLELMKDAMWKLDPGGDYRFSDRLAGQTVLFIEDMLDVRPLRDAILTTFSGRTVAIEELERFTIIQTPYKKSHLRKPVLSPLEKEGTIQVRRPGKHGFPAGTTVYFPNA